MLKKIYSNYLLVAGVLFVTLSCEDFVEIDTPNFQIVSDEVFSDDQTAIASVNGIYSELMRAEFSNGWEHSVTVLGGMSADIIQPISTTQATFSPFWHDADLRHAASHVSGYLHGKLDQAAGDTRAVHQASCEDEQGHCQQRHTLGLADRQLNNGSQRKLHMLEEIEYSGDAQGKSDRDSDEEQEQEYE